MSLDSAEISTSAASAQLRWPALLILAAILAGGAALRFYEITREGLWPDEFWSSVHLATGRGVAFTQLPTGVVIDPAPPTLLDGAPHWWHIWTGLRGIVHPPLYLIFLRWWMDLFGTGDLATRTFSALASLAGIVVLFDIVRRTVSTPAALIAAALMAIAPLQIDLSQQTRPYTLLTLVGLLACHAIVRIEQSGPSKSRLIELGIAVAATALTHYFSLGALIGLTCYAVFRFRGPTRRKVLATIAISSLVVAVVWGPFLWQQHREFFRQGAWALETSGGRTMAFIRAAAMPSILLYNRTGNTLGWIAPAVIAFLLPLLWIRRSPQLMLWWFWIVGVVGSIFVYDLLNAGRLLATPKYTSLAAVGVYALCAVPLPYRTQWRWIIPVMMLVSVAITTIMRVQEGPSPDNGDWRGLAVSVDKHAGPRDLLVFYPDPFWGTAGMYYLAFSHYAQNHDRPIMLLDGPADAGALKAMSHYNQIWLIGPSPQTDTHKLVPGWESNFQEWYPNSGGLISLKPAPRPATTTSPAPSRPEPR